MHLSGWELTGIISTVCLVALSLAASLVSLLLRARGWLVSPTGVALVHMTSSEGANGIRLSREIWGKHGVFAVADRVRRWPILIKMILAGLPPRRFHSFVQIPADKTVFFRRIHPAGPYTLLKWLGLAYVLPFRRMPYLPKTTPSQPCGWQTFCVVYSCDAACLLLLVTYLIGLSSLRG